MLGAASAGSVPLPLTGVLASLVHGLGLGMGAPLPPSSETILWVVRLPRVLLAAAVGGGLAVVGATLQSVFRNPLADSGLLGVGAGAALGAVAAVRLGWAGSTFLALPLAAFAGAMAAVLVLYALSQALGRRDAARAPAHRDRRLRAGRARAPRCCWSPPRSSA